jgi:hypothetical protein
VNQVLNAIGSSEKRVAAVAVQVRKHRRINSENKRQKKWPRLFLWKLFKHTPEPGKGQAGGEVCWLGRRGGSENRSSSICQGGETLSKVQEKTIDNLMGNRYIVAEIQKLPNKLNP